MAMITTDKQICPRVDKTYVCQGCHTPILVEQPRTRFLLRLIGVRNAINIWLHRDKQCGEKYAKRLDSIAQVIRLNVKTWSDL